MSWASEPHRYGAHLGRRGGRGVSSAGGGAQEAGACTGRNRGLAVRHAGARAARTLPGAADPDGAVGVGQRLDGQGQPVLRQVGFVGADNYQPLLSEPGLSRQDFMLSLRNTFYYVVGVVPLQTVLALLLAVVVNQRFLKGRTFFRTAFYFPSVVSSVAISLVFLYLFTGGGAVNQGLDAIGLDGPHLVRRLTRPDPPARQRARPVGHRQPAVRARRPRRDRPVAGGTGSTGPSVALSAIMMQVVWTTAGTFMLHVPRRAAGPAHRRRGGRDGRRRQQVATSSAT